MGRRRANHCSARRSAEMWIDRLGARAAMVNEEEHDCKCAAIRVGFRLRGFYQQVGITVARSSSFRALQVQLVASVLAGCSLRPAQSFAGQGYMYRGCHDAGVSWVSSDARLFDLVGVR